MDQKGLSLLESVLGGAISIGIALGIMRVNSNNTKLTKTFEKNNEMVTQIAEIRSVLAIPAACTNSFLNRDATNTTGIVELRDKDNQPAFETGKQYGSSRLTINSYRLSDAGDTVTVNPGDTGTTNLYIEFNRGKDINGTK